MLATKMNQRIQELAKQAGASRRAGVGGLVFRDAELKKFAELIVQKCADIGERYADGNYEFYNQILEYFGMEKE